MTDNPLGIRLTPENRAWVDQQAMRTNSNRTKVINDAIAYAAASNPDMPENHQALADRLCQLAGVLRLHIEGKVK